MIAIPVWQQGPVTFGLNQDGMALKLEIPVNNRTKFNLGISQDWDGERSYGALFQVRF